MAEANQANQNQVTQTQNHSVIRLIEEIHRYLTGLLLGVFVQCISTFLGQSFPWCVPCGSVLALIYILLNIGKLENNYIGKLLLQIGWRIL